MKESYTRKMTSASAVACARRTPVTLPGQGRSEIKQLASHDGYEAWWRGRAAPCTFRSKAGARAWIEMCNRAGEWRA